MLQKSNEKNGGEQKKAKKKRNRMYKNYIFDLYTEPLKNSQGYRKYKAYVKGLHRTGGMMDEVPKEIQEMVGKTELDVRDKLESLLKLHIEKLNKEESNKEKKVNENGEEESPRHFDMHGKIV